LIKIEMRVKNVDYLESETKSPLGLIHTRHFDKNIFLNHGFLLTKVSSKQNSNQGTLCFVKSLPWLVIEIHGSKISFIAILCSKMSRVNKAINEK